MEFDPDKGHIMARTIVEILGKPQKHVEETIAKVTEEIEKREGIWMLDKDISKAKKIEGLWSIFAEMEIHFKGFEELATFSFDFMPSSMEIIQPENLRLHGSHLSGLLNDLLAGLHNLDMRFKNLKVQANILEKNNQALLRNCVLVALHYEPRDLKELAGVVGIKELQLAPYLTRLMEQGFIKQDDDEQYHVAKK